MRRVRGRGSLIAAWGGASGVNGRWNGESIAGEGGIRNSELGGILCEGVCSCDGTGLIGVCTVGSRCSSPRVNAATAAGEEGEGGEGR